MADEFEWMRLERTIDAPLADVWDMWTRPELFSQWYGPNGMSVPVAEMALEVGGTRKICMSMETPERSMKMWFTGEFKELSAPHRLVYTESMCDEDGNIIPPESMGMPAGHPEVTEVIVELAEKEGKTRLKLTHIGVSADSGGAGGWAQALDKLTAHFV